jgi:hypothetical protein
VDRVTDARKTEHLRVLIANERKDRLALVAPIVVALGHEVIAREIDVQDVGPVTARERPDVALVGLGESSEHALELIDTIVREAACPRDGGRVVDRADLGHPLVVALLGARQPCFGMVGAWPGPSRSGLGTQRIGSHHDPRPVG